MRGGMRAWARRLLLGSLGLVLAVPLAVLALAMASLGRHDGRLTVDGLEAPATIERDARGIPSIAASSEADAYRALGLAHGQDRLWQMELGRRAGQGRLAEVLGETAVPTDLFMRTLGLARAAAAAVAHLDPASRQLMAAYAQGVNAAIAAYPVLPPEFLILRHAPEPWTVADSMLIGRLLALELGQGWRNELRYARLARLLTPQELQDLHPGRPASPRTLVEVGSGEIELPDTSGLGSNIFVLGGSRTRDGKPILASDPHLGLRMPGHWYLARLAAPGLDVMGGTIPGLPVVVIGRNADVTWGFTNTHADTEDLFVERIDAADPERYLAPEGSLPFLSHMEEIKVRGGETLRQQVRGTRHGTVLSDVPQLAGLAAPGMAVALSWPALREDDVTPAAGFDLARARDVGEVRAALRRFTAPVQNAAFADRHGGIGFLTAGRIPIRRGGDGRQPVDGSAGAHDWLGFIPFEELPQAINPAADLLVNANNPVVGDDYPYLITADWDGPMRARRILELLDGRAAVSAGEAAAIQLDQQSGIAQALLPFLRDLAGRDDEQRRALAMLAAWDGQMLPDRPEPLLFAGWYTAFRQSLIADEVADGGEPRAEVVAHLVLTRPGWCDDVRTTTVESCADLALVALDAARAALQVNHGRDLATWRWGPAHQAQLGHEPFRRLPVLAGLFGRTIAVGGDATTVNVAAWRGGVPGGPFPVVHAAGLRLVADMAGRGLLAVTATGQSGHPLSRHLDDLTKLWAAGETVTMPTTAPPTARLVLEPPLRVVRGGG